VTTNVLVIVLVGVNLKATRGIPSQGRVYKKEFPTSFLVYQVRVEVQKVGEQEFMIEASSSHEFKGREE